MNPERWQKLDRIFAAAEHLNDEQRERLLAQECEGDEELRAQVVRMLAMEPEAAQYVGKAVADAVELAVEAEQNALVGTLLGAYRIEKFLGKGGMGTVYLARRSDGEFNKQVAIKMVRGGFTSEAMAARFRAERQILATLDHPNCCRLLDGGISSTGAPYLVMEYVDGRRIDEYCEGLSERRCLELCLQLVSALEMAHRQLIVHRDIKPGNVLVDQTGKVKLLDFGIAKLLGTEQRGAAASIEILATPEYASPEQMRGEVVTTASDLYSLGKLMEVLLPGARGELRAILRKATHEEAERRYRSVEQLGEDLRRYLGGFPVLAQPDSWWYRTRKFVRRNPVGAVAASIAILSIVTGVVATRREQLRTERRFNEVREIATSFLFEFHDSVEKLPGSMEARRLLVTRALKYLELLSSESRDEALQADVAAAYGKVSRMQWRGGGSHLGDPVGARESALREVSLREELLRAKPSERARRLALASALARLAELTATGLAKARDAIDPTLRAVGLLDEVLREAAEDPEVLEQVAAGHAQLGSLRMRLGDPKQALEEFRKAADWRETLKRLRPGDLWNQRMLGWMHVYAGDALGGGGAEVHLGDRQGALESTMKGERVFEALAQAHNIAAARDLNVSRTRIAGVQEMMGRFDEALRWRKATLQQAIDSAKQDPLDADAARSVGLNYHGTGLLLMKMGRYDEAEAMVRAGMKGGNGSIEAVMDQANLEHLMGELSRRRKQAGPAVQHMQAAIALREAHLRGSADSRLRWRQAKSFEGLAEAQLMAGKRSAAADAFEAALAIYVDLQKSGTLSPGEAGTPAALAARVSELRR